MWEAVKKEEMKIPWKDANEGPPISEEQYQERFWRRRLDGIGLDTEQYTNLLTGLHAVGQVKGWKVQQLVFVGGTCVSVHVESFNKNMKDWGSLKVSGTLFVRR